MHPSVIDAAFYGIKWAHSLAGIPSPTANPIVEAVRSASKRIFGTATVNLKEPISSNVIRDIIIIHSDEGLTLETSVFESFYGG